MRQGAREDKLREVIANQINSRAIDGWEAERLRHDSKGVHESMATIGG